MPHYQPPPGVLGTGPIVRHGRNPLAVCLLAVLVVSGVAGLFNPEKASPTLSRVLGDYVWVWNSVLILGCLLTLVGILILKPLNDVLIERIGAIWLASLFLIYGVVVAIVNGLAVGTTSTGISIGLGIAFAIRVWQITKDLGRLRQVLQALPARGEPPK